VKDTLVGARKLKLVYAEWEADAQPKAVVVLVHGYGEHMGRYGHVIKALNAEGYHVWTIDHRGHGESAGVRAHVERFDYFVEDLHLLVGKAKAAHPLLPLFMLGHSMGGLIATRYALQHQSMLDGLILSGTALMIGDNVSPLMKRVSGVLATVAPRMPMVFTGDSAESVLSRDPLVQEAFDADPLNYRGKLRARMGHEMMRAAVNARGRSAELHLPMLVMHGADDKLTNPRGSTLLYEGSPSADKTLKLWEGCRHEIFNEPEKDEVIAFTIAWLDRHVEAMT
jgi:acylglycerol lipase